MKCTTVSSGNTTTIEPPRIVVVDGRWRVVRPYLFAFVAVAKGRWVGRSTRHVLVHEFGVAEDYVTEAHLMKRIRVLRAPSRRNGAVPTEEISVDAPLLEKDQVTHIVHRHEPPVPWRRALTVLRNTAAGGDGGTALVAVDKPAGIPVHATGRYAYNTLVRALWELPRCSGYVPCHRLDQCTSGVVLFAVNRSLASTVNALLTKAVKAVDSESLTEESSPQRSYAIKTYVARVHGAFQKVLTREVVSSPNDAHVLRRSFMAQVASTNIKDVWERAVQSATAESRQPHSWPSVIDAPIVASAAGAPNTFNVAPSDSSLSSSSSGTRCVSLFCPLRYDPETDETLVLCSPLSGKTHQLRVHLAHLGHPIVGDAKYGAMAVSRGLVSETAPPVAVVQALKEGFVADSLCVDCQNGSPVLWPEHESVSICLHALQYDLRLPIGEFSFRAEAPVWAAMSC